MVLLTPSDLFRFDAAFLAEPAIDECLLSAIAACAVLFETAEWARLRVKGNFFTATQAATLCDSLFN